MKKNTVLGLEVPCGPNGVSVITVLQAIQGYYGYLPEEALEKAARELKVPLIDFYSVATFYKNFRLAPQGRREVVTCTGTACHVRGSEKITEEISRTLGVDISSTTEDGEYSLKCVNCVGACALAPLIIVDGRYYGQMTPLKVRRLFSDNPTKTEQTVSSGLSK